MGNFKIAHLLVNPREDSIYPITWVAANCDVCKLDKNYKDDHEPVLSSAIWVRLPGSNGWHAYGINDEGWLSTCNSYNDNIVDRLPETTIVKGVLDVEETVNDWVNNYSRPS